jgi:hypothetical protein
MTLVRGLAVRISERMVRWAAPGCKEWAEGLEREVEFIESDWRALAWAVGSIRVVLDRTSSPLGSGHETQRPPLWWAWPICIGAWAFSYSLSALRATCWHDRISSGLISFGWILWGALSFATWLREQSRPPISQIDAYLSFSRMTLEHRLKRYRSQRRWLPLLVPLSMVSGFAMSYQGEGEWGHISTGVVIVAGAIAAWLLCLDTPAKIELRLARLNDRIVEREKGGVR